MKKKQNWYSPSLEDLTLQLFRMISLLAFSLLVVFFQVSANENSRVAGINIDVEESSLNNVIQKIQQQTNKNFIYSAEDVDGIYLSDVRLYGASLEKTLKQCLKGTNLEYELSQNTVIIRSRSSEKVKNISEAGGIVTGKVSSDGEFIPGVSVVIKGTTIGTITDIDGKFSLSGIPDNAVLVFSFVGMETQEIQYSGQKTLNVKMISKTEGIDEVVVVGYGVQKKVSVSGSVASVDTKELTNTSASTLGNALAGKLPGLSSIQNGGGQPGKDYATIYLRGASTVNGKSPLILIDGVPRTNINTLDTHEVASVSVLKDASATALFGVRGANGVIMITTIRGTKGKSDLSVNVEQNYTSFTKEPKRIHSWEYMKLRNEAYINDGESAKYSDAEISKYTNPLDGLDPDDPDYKQKAMVRNYIYPDHDYYRELINKYTPSTKVNANMSGGTDKVTYFMNASFYHQGGNLNTEPKSYLGYDPSSKMNRWTFRANIDYKISNTVSALLNLGTYIERVNMPSVSAMYGNDQNWMMRDLFYQAKTILPITVGPTTIAGYGVEPGQIVDPGYLDRSAFEIMNRLGYHKDVRTNLNSSFGLNWDLGTLVTKGLSIKGLGSYDAYSGSSLQAGKSERLYHASVNTTTNELSYSVYRDTENSISVSRSTSSYYNINLQGFINYARSFGSNNVGGMVLVQRDFWDHGAEIPHNVVGMSGRFTYDYNNSYFVECDMGYNGSEQFSPDKRYGFFPAFSGGWVVSNEDFLKGNDILTFIKLRASYGKVGNDQMGDRRFLYLDDTSIGGGTLNSLGNGTNVVEGIRGNINLTWESAWKSNFGVDFQLFENLNGSFDYFKEHRTDILISRHTVPAFQGVALGNIPLQNLGVVDNHGYEIELNYKKKITNDLSFTIKGNFSYNHNEVKKYDEVARDSSYYCRTRVEGYSLGTQWGYKVDWDNTGGYWTSQDEIDNSSLSYDFGTPRPGDFKYIDLNGDNVINDKDQVPIKNPSIPRINYGVTLGVNWKNFDFSVFIQGVGQFASQRANQGVYEYIKEGTYFGYHRNAWTPERWANGDNITYPALSTHATTNHVANDFFIMDRSFTRLKNIELGYSLKDNPSLSMAGISNIRIYVSGHNLYTWDHQVSDDIDPENDDPIGYPVTKMVNFGINITF